MEMFRWRSLFKVDCMAVMQAWQVIPSEKRRQQAWAQFHRHA